MTHYSHYTEIYEGALEAVRKVAGVVEADVDSTGGGLYAIGVRLADGTSLLLTDSDGLDWDRADAEGWMVGHYLADGEWDESFGNAAHGDPHLYTLGMGSDEAAAALVSAAIAMLSPMADAGYGGASDAEVADALIGLADGKGDDMWALLTEAARRLRARPGEPTGLGPCPHCDQAAATADGCCVHCGADRSGEAVR
jgi:hypothetical protein